MGIRTIPGLSNRHATREQMGRGSSIVSAEFKKKNHGRVKRGAEWQAEKRMERQQRAKLKLLVKEFYNGKQPTLHQIDRIKMQYEEYYGEGDFDSLKKIFPKINERCAHAIELILKAQREDWYS